MAGMHPTRAERVRGEIAALARSGATAAAFCAQSGRLLRRAVPYDWACLATLDPASELITSVVKVDLDDAHDAEFAHFEYEVDDLNTFVKIARRPTPIGVLHVDTDGHPERCARWRDFLVPRFGPAQELRAVLRCGSRAWGALALYRAGGSARFSPAETSLLASIAPTMAAGIRAGLVTARHPGATPVDGPAVIIVGAGNTVVHSTPAARQRLDELGGGTTTLPVPVLSVIGSARAYGAGLARQPPRARLRTAPGQWLIAHAASLGTAGGTDVVLTLEEARPPEVVPLVVAALGLTAREREVVGLVLQGADTRQIACALHVSPYTVQDHLKSVFDKAGVSSRRELTARVFLEHCPAGIDVNGPA